VVNSVEESNRFLWDLRRSIADAVAYEYVGGLRKISNENNLKLWLENYGHWGFPSEFLMYGGQSNLVAGEFWNEGSLGNIECKSSSSAAHIYGKPVTYAEAFTAAEKAFLRHPALLKKRGDWSFTEGYSYDYINAEVILNRLLVKDGKFVLPDGMSYKILVLPPIKTMRPELLAKIESLVVKGGVIFGQAPEKSPSLANYKDLVKLKSLSDWSLSDNEKIRYYSGTAIYKSSFEISNIPESEELFINMGDVNVMAKVKFGGSWVLCCIWCHCSFYLL